MKRYLEVMCPESHMNTVKTICKLANKVEVKTLEHKQFDISILMPEKTPPIHYIKLELKGSKKHVNKLIKKLQSYGK